MNSPRNPFIDQHRQSIVPSSKSTGLVATMSQPPDGKIMSEPHRRDGGNPTDGRAVSRPMRSALNEIPLALLHSVCCAINLAPLKMPQHDKAGRPAADRPGSNMAKPAGSQMRPMINCSRSGQPAHLSRGLSPEELLRRDIGRQPTGWTAFAAAPPGCHKKGRRSRPFCLPAPELKRTSHNFWNKK